MDAVDAAPAGRPRQHRLVPRLVLVSGALEQRRRLLGRRAVGQVFQQPRDARRHRQPAEKAGHQRIGPQPVGAVELVIALADGEGPRNVRLLVARRADGQAVPGVGLVVAPQAAHRIMDGGKNLHRRRAGIGALELLVDFQNAGQLPVQQVARQVGHVEIDAHPVRLRAESLLDADLENLSRGDVARQEVSIFRVALFEEIQPLALGDVAPPGGNRADGGAPTRVRLRRGRSR